MKKNKFFIFTIAFIVIIIWIIEGTIILLQETVVQCYNVIHDITREEYESVLNINSTSDTPVNVLDEHFLSLESEKTNGTNVVVTQEQDFKRRKTTDYGNNRRVPFSHFHQC